MKIKPVLAMTLGLIFLVIAILMEIFPSEIKLHDFIKGFLTGISIPLFITFMVTIFQKQKSSKQ